MERRRPRFRLAQDSSRGIDLLSLLIPSRPLRRAAFFVEPNSASSARGGSPGTLGGVQGFNRNRVAKEFCWEESQGRKSTPNPKPNPIPMPIWILFWFRIKPASGNSVLWGQINAPGTGKEDFPVFPLQKIHLTLDGPEPQHISDVG